MSEETTTIQVTRKTHSFLEAYGRKNETFDMIIRRLAREAGWTKEGYNV